MVVDIAQVSDVGPERLDHVAQLLPRLARVERMRRSPGAA